jgi:hypothetical protein
MELRKMKMDNRNMERKIEKAKVRRCRLKPG